MKARLSRVLAPFVLLLGAMENPAFAAPASDQAMMGAWRSIARYFPREAEREFIALARAGGGDSRGIQLGLALCDLSSQPVTHQRIMQARERLVQLAAGDDESALAAGYFLGRLAQNYLEKPDYDAAAEHYRRLVARHPDTHWGQLALGKLAILVLYALPASDPAARIARAEALLPTAGRTTARDLHIMIADASLFYELPKAPALQHLLAAERMDRDESSLAAGIKSDILVQIIKLSVGLGQLRQAEDYLRRFRATYPRDWRLYTIEQILQAAAAGCESPVP